MKIGMKKERKILEGRMRKKEGLGRPKLCAVRIYARRLFASVNRPSASR
jgi:hypothetical protein